MPVCQEGRGRERHTAERGAPRAGGDRAEAALPTGTASTKRGARRKPAGSGWRRGTDWRVMRGTALPTVGTAVTTETKGEMQKGSL